MNVTDSQKLWELCHNEGYAIIVLLSPAESIEKQRHFQDPLSYNCFSHFPKQSRPHSHLTISQKSEAVRLNRDYIVTESLLHDQVHVDEY